MPDDKPQLPAEEQTTKKEDSNEPKTAKLVSPSFEPKQVKPFQKFQKPNPQNVGHKMPVFTRSFGGHQ